VLLHKKTKKAEVIVSTKDFSFLILIGFYSVCFLLKIAVAVSLKKWDKSQTVFSEEKLLWGMAFVL